MSPQGPKNAVQQLILLLELLQFDILYPSDHYFDQTVVVMLRIKCLYSNF